MTPVHPVAHRQEGHHRPCRVVCNSIEYSDRLRAGTARVERGKTQVLIERQFVDISKEGSPITWCPIWLPCHVDDGMPPHGLWDVMGFWKEHAEPVT